MRRLLVSAALLTLLLLPGPAVSETISVVERPDAALGNDHYAGNRAPLAPSPLVKLPAGSIRPMGWVRRQLELEAEGFIGHLDELSGFVRKENNSWLSPTGEGENPWEELPYWLKGFGDLGYVLGDERIIREARVWTEAAISGR